MMFVRQDGYYLDKRIFRLARSCSRFVRLKTCDPSPLETKYRKSVVSGFSDDQSADLPGFPIGPGGSPKFR